MNKKRHENIMNFNIGNEFAVQLYSKGKITFGDITKIIQKTLTIDLKIKLNDIDNVLLYHPCLTQPTNLQRLFSQT